MPSMSRTLAAAALAAGIVAGGALLVSRNGGEARAADGAAPCTAFLAGLGTTKGSVPELVVFNVTDTELSLDLTLRDGEGAVLVSREAEVVVAPRQTVFVDLLEQLARDLPRGEKPHAGPLAVELRGEAGFDASTAIVHVVQYFGSKAKPRAAYVLRPVYRAD